MKYKVGQRVAFYEVTRISDPAPGVNATIGTVLIDRPRGATTTWDFVNTETGQSSWLAARRLGFAVVNDAFVPIPEPKLQEILDAKKEAKDGNS